VIEHWHTLTSSAPCEAGLPGRLVPDLVMWALETHLDAGADTSERRDDLATFIIAANRLADAWGSTEALTPQPPTDRPGGLVQTSGLE